MRCIKHDQETAVSCGRCEAPICPKCMVHTDVGVRCRNCAPATPTPRTRKGVSVLGVGALVVIGIVVLGSLAGGRSSTSTTADDAEGIREATAEVTVRGMADPWTVPDMQAAPGRRYVAFDVVIENPIGSGAPHYTAARGFKLSDSQRFVYAPESVKGNGGLDAVTLDPGERAAGWVVFEVSETSIIEDLKYESQKLALPH